MKNCITGRNCLLAAAVTRLPRRTLELINMSLKKLKIAKPHLIEEENNHFVYVLQHKTNED